MNKQTATTDSYAPRENCICHGIMASIKALRSGTLRNLFFSVLDSKDKRFRRKRYRKSTVNVPDIIDGKRTANVFLPKIAIGTISA